MTISNLFIVIAIVLFVLAALGVSLGIDLIAWGLASFAFGHLGIETLIRRG